MKDNTIFCADCEHHFCKCECFAGEPCFGRCEIKKIQIRCFKTAKNCEYYVLAQKLRLS